jgi:hypothetical protein
MFGIKPDANGNVNLTVAAYDSSNSAFSMIGVIVIKGYNPSTNTLTQAPVGTVIDNGGATELASSFVVPVQDSAAAAGVNPLSAFPNPFDRFFNLNVPAANHDNIEVSLSDAAGKILYKQRFENLVEGNNLLRVQTASPLPSGTYFVNVLYVDENVSKLIKVVRNK